MVKHIKLFLGIIINIASQTCDHNNNRLLGYKRVYTPLYKVANTPFHIQGNQGIDFIS